MLSGNCERYGKMTDPKPTETLCVPQSTVRSIPLPVLPLDQTKQLCARLSHIPPDMVADAVQESHLLALQGLDVLEGMKQWKDREMASNPGMTDPPGPGRPVGGRVGPVTERLGTAHERGVTGPDRVKEQF